MKEFSLSLPSLSLSLTVDSEVSEVSALPPGLSVVEEFVSPEEEVELLQAVDWTSQTEELTGQTHTFPKTTF